MDRLVGSCVRRVRLLTFLFLATTFIFLVQGVSTVQADTSSFDVQAVLPKNQVTPHIEFFDIRVSPDEEQSLQVDLANLTGKTNNITIDAAAPVTDLTGKVNYTDPNSQADPSAQYSVHKLFQGPKSVILAPHETKTVTLTLKTPPKAFSGLIIGSFIFSSDSNPSVRDDKKSHRLKNEIRVSIPIGLRSTNPPIATVAPDLDLGEPKIVTSPFGGGAIQIRLRNVEPAFTGEVTGTIDVHDKDEQTNSFRYKQKTFGIAPNSFFEMFTPWGGGVVQPGHYVLTYRFSAGERNWTFTRQLIVSRDEATSVNQTQPATQNNALIWWLIAILLVVLLVVSITVLVWYRGKKRGQQLNS
jgi:hypothetical protein